MKICHLTLLLALVTLTACDRQPADSQTEIAAARTTVLNDAAAIEMAAGKLDAAGLMQHVNILASDEFEGRAPSTPGGRKTVEYLEREFSKLGLEPPFSSADGPSYRQPVELMELTVTNNPPLVITHDSGEPQSLAYKEQSIVFTSRTGEAQSISGSPLVFVGYGIVAPEYDWNDYEGVDMQGKTAVILVNDPGFRQPDGELFSGKAMTYYGRWTYKFEQAAKQGAAAAIIVHQEDAAGYPWEVVSGSWSGAQYTLFTKDGNAGNLAVESWITQQAADDLFSKSGLNFEDMVVLAGKNEFRAVPLAARVSAALELDSRKSTSYNVGAVIKGRERPQELFIYTAHWDHIGIKPDDEKEDVIYNGAQDNATGTAALLEMAEAFNALAQKPQRSVMFLAVTAEESGLLGSRHYADNPAYPHALTVAGINMDGMATYGETDDVVVVGYGNSQMDDYLKTVSATQNRVVVPEPTPEKGYFYRSDHFNLAKKGVPMLYAESGLMARGKPEGWGKAQSEEYTSVRYHKPADEVHEGWDTGGIMQDINAHFRIGVAISDSNDWPQWAEGNEFTAIREASRDGMY